MRKIALTMGAGALLLASGCTLPFTNSADVLVDTASTMIDTPESQQELFYTLAKASGENTVEMMNDILPDRDLFLKSEGEMSLDGKFNMEGTPLGGGTGELSIDVAARADYTDPENVKFSESMSINLDVLGGLAKVDGKGEIRVVDNSVYATVEKMDVNIPGVDASMEEVIQKFVGQWYGNTFDEIEEMVGEDGIDIEAMFASNAKMIEVVDIFESIAQNPIEHIEFNSFLKEENGYYFFEVTPKKETYDQLFVVLKDTFAYTSDPEFELFPELDEMMENFTPSSVTIAYTPENPEYFKVMKSMEEVDFVFENTKAGINSLVTGTSIDDSLSFVWNRSSGDFVLEGSEGEGSTPDQFVIGNYKEGSLSFEVNTIMAYESDVLESIAKGSFTKTGNAWSGEITSEQIPEGKIIFSDVRAEMEDMNAQILVMLGENTVADITMNGSTKAVSSVDVEKPESVKSFSTMVEEVEAEMNALFPPATSIPSSIEFEGEGMNEATLGEEVVIDGVDEAGVVIDPAVNQTQTDEVMEEGATEESAEENVEVSEDKDYSEITPLISEMAQMMQTENPTAESTQQFTQMAEQVQIMAQEQGITDVELQDILMSELQKNPPVVPSVPEVKAEVAVDTEVEASPVAE